VRHTGQDAEQREDDRDRRPGARGSELAADLAGEVTRVTIDAAAIDSIRLGSCATSASPIASRM